jgi:Recombinase
MTTISFARHQFPSDVIRHAVWLYFRFTLSLRDVEDLLAERGVDISYETVRRWVLLIINEAEAETVRMIFHRYLELGSVRELKASLDAEGVVSKQRTAADGSAYGGHAFSRGALYQMLQNRVYRGEIVHRGASYPGEHRGRR